MRSDKFLVTSYVNGAQKAHAWDPEEVLELGPKNDHRLEKSGGYLVLSELEGAKPVRSREPRGEGESVTIRTGEFQIEVKVLRAIPPAFRMPSEEPSRLKKSHIEQFMVFSGVGGLLRSSQPVRSAFVAYAKENPIFTVHFGADTSEVKPLLDGVKLKLKGEKVDPGKIGETWRLSTSDLLNSTVIRGSRWWRFARVPVSELLSDQTEIDGDESIEFEQKKIKKTLAGLVIGLIILAILLFLAPSTPPAPKLVPEPIVVKLKVSHGKKSDSFPVQTQHAPPGPPPSAAPPVAKAVTSPPPAPKAPTPPVAAAGPPKAGPAGLKHKEKLQAAANANRLGALRSAFKEAISLTQRNDSKAPAVSAPGSRDMFKGGKVALMPTQISPGYSGTGVKMGSLGSSVGDASGLVEGDRAKAVGGGPSFASVGGGTPDVQEGLTREEVGRVIHQHMNEIRSCQDSAMLYVPNIQGKLQVKFVINGQGIVNRADKEDSTLPDEYLANCVLKRIPTWRFPKPKNGVNVSVSYPFLFKTLRRD